MTVEFLKDHSRILLDSCIWIYYLEDHPHFADIIEDVLEHCVNSGLQLFCSELSLFEIKIGPLRCGKERIAAEYQVYLDQFPGLSLRPIDRAVLNRAARIRVRFGIKTPDAIILATGIESNATLALTNDQQWKKVGGIEVVCLNDLRE